MKHISFIVAILFNSYLFGEEWNCVSKDSYLQDLKCTAQNGEVFSFESKSEPSGNKYEVNEDMQLDIVTFVKAIGPGKTIKASTQEGDKLSGLSLAGGKIKASVVYANGDSYEGIMLGAYRQGKGIYKKKEYVLEGEFTGGYLEGEGSKTYLNKNKVITGEFLDSLPNGLIEVDETYVNEDGNTVIRNYKGQAKNGFWHGIGQQEIKTVSKFVGAGLIFLEYLDPGAVGARFWVSEVIKDSPASRSGLKAGDKIISIKNAGKPKQDAKYLTSSELRNLLVGKKGRPVDIEIFRFDEDNQQKILTLKLIRDQIITEFTEIFEGRFVDGKRSGYGKSVTSDGRSYEGTWENNNWDGFGKRTWGEGNHYLGTYKNGSCEGTGMQLNQNYDIVYYGEFHKCAAHGQGGSILHNPDGTKDIKTGKFFENRLDGYGEAYYANGDVYKGNWKRDTWSGYGEVYDQDLRRTITGLFEDGKLKDGQGTYTTDSFKYSGLFKDTLMHGKGVMYTRRINDAEPVWTDEKYVIMEKGLEIGAYEPQKSEKEKRIALVVGNGAYISSRLENSVNDSMGIMKTLQTKGFEVVHKTNLKQKDFKQAIWDFEELVKSYKGKVTALFFYAGHAVQIDGDNYLIPIDSKMNQQRDIELGSINAQTIINSLSNATEGVKILIMDACRNNPFKSYSRNISGGLAQMSAPIGTIVAYSTAPGEVALDGTASGYGIYTGNLINALNTPGLTIEQVFKRTRMDVAGMTNGQQVPWESSSLIGDFYFLKNN